MEEELFEDNGQSVSLGDASSTISTKDLQSVLIPFTESTLNNASNFFKQDSELLFTAIDYTIFGIMLALSALIGVYFGFISKKKQNNTNEYLLGGKQMNFFPIAASLIAR